MSQTRIKIKKNKKRADKTRRSARYWMAVGTMAAYTTFSGDALLKLHAQQDRSAPTVQASGQTQGLTVRHFDIPPGTLEIVLAAYERTVQFHVTVPRDSMRGIWSPGVAGLYTPQAALEKLLAGTGIGYRLTGPDKATLEIQGMATAIDVTAPTLEDTLPLLTQPLIDTPQSIDVVPQHVIQDQGATTLRDTLRNVAGISLAAGEGGAQGDSLTIRGFTARNDIFLDGMRDFGSYYRDPFNMQEVAVLQGPSSIAFGRGSTGGVVNQETKVAQTGHILTGDVELGTDQTKRITADIDRALPSLGSGTAFRLNLMGHESKFAGRDIAENRRFGIAPSLAFGLGTPTRLTFSYLHQGADDTPDYGIPWLFNGPAPVDRRNYYGFEHGNYLRTNVDLGTIKLDHDFSDKITFRNQARYAHYHRDLRITEAQIGTTFDGDKVTPTTPLDEIQVNRNQIAVNSLETFLQDQVDVTMRFRTGFLRHTLVAGAEGGRETSSPHRTRYDITGSLPTSVPKTGLLHPDTSEAFSGDILNNLTNRRTCHRDQRRRLCRGYCCARAQMGSNWWRPCGSLRRHIKSTSATELAKPRAGRCHAQLADRAGVQAGNEWQHLLRLRNLVQSIGRDARAQRQHGRYRAGRKQNHRSRNQVGSLLAQVVASVIGVPHHQGKRSRN